MKKIIILLMSLTTTVFYAQSTEDIELANRINNLVLTNISNLAGKDYMIFETGPIFTTVIGKINNTYEYYLINIDGAGGQVEIKTSKTINPNPVLDKIFSNFSPKPNVKRYVSEYGYNVLKTHILFKTYFGLYKNGIRTFDTCLPAVLDDNRIESPIDDETLTFLYHYLVVHPDQL
ncbi:hypothetical protein B6A10_16100 [Flavobacterium sp. L1I52]|uniref:Uncharacterized protein n=1 Tax=Flavobacterium pokkalii TaxID=1940408 RepID=A0ABR7UYT8_9FLAO|nr:hypothetical protein [Flavobacterium pokkalii]MBD0726694.1 hypothetical protein [Flavobacterium pokkalii]